jgi:hypothetical protein
MALGQLHRLSIERRPANKETRHGVAASCATLDAVVLGAGMTVETMVK